MPRSATFREPPSGFPVEPWNRRWILYDASKKPCNLSRKDPAGTVLSLSRSIIQGSSYSTRSGSHEGSHPSATSSTTDDDPSGSFPASSPDAFDVDIDNIVNAVVAQTSQPLGSPGATSNVDLDEVIKRREKETEAEIKRGGGGSGRYELLEERRPVRSSGKSVFDADAFLDRLEPYKRQVEVDLARQKETKHNETEIEEGELNEAAQGQLQQEQLEMETVSSGGFEETTADEFQASRRDRIQYYSVNDSAGDDGPLFKEQVLESPEENANFVIDLTGSPTPVGRVSPFTNLFRGTPRHTDSGDEAGSKDAVHSRAQGPFARYASGKNTFQSFNTEKAHEDGSNLLSFGRSSTSTTMKVGGSSMVNSETLYQASFGNPTGLTAMNAGDGALGFAKYATTSHQGFRGSTHADSILSSSNRGLAQRQPAPMSNPHLPNVKAHKTYDKSLSELALAPSAFLGYDIARLKVRPQGYDTTLHELRPVEPKEYQDPNPIKSTSEQSAPLASTAGLSPKQLRRRRRELQKLASRSSSLEKTGQPSTIEQDLKVEYDRANSLFERQVIFPSGPREFLIKLCGAPSWTVGVGFPAGYPVHKPYVFTSATAHDPERLERLARSIIYNFGQGVCLVPLVKALHRALESELPRIPWAKGIPPTIVSPSIGSSNEHPGRGFVIREQHQSVIPKPYTRPTLTELELRMDELMRDPLTQYPPDIPVFGTRDGYKSAFWSQQYAKAIRNNSIEGNQRLEFLGDKICSSLLAAFLHKHYQISEHGMSLLNAFLLSNQMFAVFSRAYHFPEKLHSNERGAFELDRGEKFNADIFEAVVGGLYLDADAEFDGQRKLLGWFGELVEPWVDWMLERLDETQRDKWLTYNGVAIEDRETRVGNRIVPGPGVMVGRKRGKGAERWNPLGRRGREGHLAAWGRSRGVGGAGRRMR